MPRRSRQSGLRSAKRSGQTSSPGRQTQRAKTYPEQRVESDVPVMELHIPSIESLDELSDWLGTFRERLRMAHPGEQPHVAAVVEELEIHYRRRRAELS
jgi:hypothetical protein